MSSPWRLTLTFTDAGVTFSDGHTDGMSRTDVDLVREALTAASVTVVDVAIDSGTVLQPPLTEALRALNRSTPPTSVTVEARGLGRDIDRRGLDRALASVGIDPARVAVVGGGAVDSGHVPEPTPDPGRWEFGRAASSRASGESPLEQTREKVDSALPFVFIAVMAAVSLFCVGGILWAVWLADTG